MREASLIELAGRGRAAGYRVELLRGPRPCERGIRHGDPPGAELLAWDAIRCALAAEVGEPEGVRTVVFDLVVGESDGAFAVRRLDAEPGEEAMALAATLARALGNRAASSIKSLAVEGLPMSWYPDLEEFETAALEALSHLGR